MEIFELIAKWMSLDVLKPGRAGIPFAGGGNHRLKAPMNRQARRAGTPKVRWILTGN
jgi:hypothetical protein